MIGGDAKVKCVSVWAAPLVGVLRFGLVEDTLVALVQKGVKQWLT